MVLLSKKGILSFFRPCGHCGVKPEIAQKINRVPDETDNMSMCATVLVKRRDRFRKKDL